MRIQRNTIHSTKEMLHHHNQTRGKIKQVPFSLVGHKYSTETAIMAMSEENMTNG